MNKLSKLIGAAALSAALLVSGCSGASSASPSSISSADQTATAPTAANTLAPLPSVPSFDLVSQDVTTDDQLALDQMSGAFGVPGGGDISPQLSWSDFPEETQSFVVTMFDPDAPTGSGFWHWVVADLPATTTSLAAGAASDGMPAGAVQLTNDAGVAGYIGAAPPAGDDAHRYVITVSALAVEHIELPEDASPAMLGFLISSETIARATLTPVASVEN